jgi:hypothetical protein
MSILSNIANFILLSFDPVDPATTDPTLHPPLVCHIDQCLLNPDQAVGKSSSVESPLTRRGRFPVRYCSA